MDAISIEQNNKIRVALGLKPLPVPGAAPPRGPVFRESNSKHDSESESDEEPGSTLESRTAQAGDNWKRLQEQEEAKRRRQQKSEAIKRARDTAQRFAKLEGKSLGESKGAADLDAKAWLTQHKKLQREVEKERARKLAEELAERERIVEYSSKDLAGVRVGHEIDEFDSGEQILTLKDAGILEDEDEGDELENLELREREKLKERLDLKKRKPGYDPHEADGTGSILAQYDEEIEGKKRKRFTLDADGLTSNDREAHMGDLPSKRKGQPISLDIIQESTPSDYMDPIEIKVKKPKKKTKSMRRKARLDDEDIFPTIETLRTANGKRVNGDYMDTDDGTSRSMSTSSTVLKRPHEQESFVDDEDLQALLAVQRRASFKKRNSERPEQIARQIREESGMARNEMETDETNAEDGEPGLVIDETSEFVANLQRPTVPERRQRSISRASEEPPSEPESPAGDEIEDVDMEKAEAYADADEYLREVAAQGEPSTAMPATGLEEEATIDQGLGATLSMLRQRGLVKDSGSGDISTLHRARQKFLLEKRRRETEAEKRARVQRERDRSSGKLERMSARDREEYARWENKQRDQQESRLMAEIFNREYKPDVQLKYVDEFGRQMNQKEAFKDLSHQFHGKNSGKMKTEKRLKKIDDEKKREAMSTLSSSQNTGMNNAMGATARRNRQAGVRLG